MATEALRTREWTLTRGVPDGQAIFGTFDMGGGFPCHSLERLAVAIPAGRYRLDLTVSSRASFGQLWSPYPDHRLPLLCDVPGRSGIRIHAGNVAADSEGCVLVGGEVIGASLNHSRPALTRIVNDLHDALSDGDEVWLTVRSQA